MGRYGMFLDKLVLFLLHFCGEIILVWLIFVLIWCRSNLKLLNYLFSFNLLLFNLINNFSFVALLAKVGKFAHSLVQHRQKLVGLKIEIFL